MLNSNFNYRNTPKNTPKLKKRHVRTHTMQIDEIKRLLTDIKTIQTNLNKETSTRNEYNDKLVELSFLMKAEAITDNFNRLYLLRKELIEFL